LARKIIRRRKAAGLTQTDLARRAEIRPETLSRLEKEKSTPDVETVAETIRVLERVEAKAST
jgi:DNA-binding XRE family transcriptional regulator